MKQRFFPIIILAISLLMAAGCSEKETSFARLQYSQYSFKHTADTLTVDVDFAGQNWETTADADWIQSIKQDKSSLLIIVQPNDNGECREGTVSVFTESLSESILIHQEGRAFNGKMFDLTTTSNGFAMSRNGRFIVYTYLESLNTIPLVTNMETGETIDYAGIVNERVQIFGITDDGQTLLVQNGNMETALLTQDGMEVLDLCSYKSFTPVAMSADASVIAGTVKMADNSTAPAYWKGGSFTTLECPEQDPVGNMLMPGNIRVQGCSADGSVIYGAEYRSSSYGLIYWKDGVLHNPGNDHAEIVTVLLQYGSNLREQVRASTVAYDEDMNGSFLVSPDGKYMTAMFITYEQPEGEVAAIVHTCPVIIDLASGEVTKVEASINGAMGLAIDNSGMIFGIGAGAIGTYDGFVFNPATQQALDIAAYFKSNYGVMMNGDRYISMVSADGKAFMGKKDNLTYWYLRL